jgi:hypothetical protein
MKEGDVIQVAHVVRDIDKAMKPCLAAIPGGIGCRGRRRPAGCRRIT